MKIQNQLASNPLYLKKISLSSTKMINFLKNLTKFFENIVDLSFQPNQDTTLSPLISIYKTKNFFAKSIKILLCGLYLTNVMMGVALFTWINESDMFLTSIIKYIHEFFTWSDHTNTYSIHWIVFLGIIGLMPAWIVKYLNGIIKFYLI